MSINSISGNTPIGGIKSWHINPDHFLQTAQGRVVTSERNRLAWQQCYNLLNTALAQACNETKLHILIGAQGSGKSTWVKQYQALNPSKPYLFFDAILVKHSERQPIIETAQQYQVECIAVWIQTPLAICIAQNRQRPDDERVPEQAIRNVYAALQPPMLEEGFATIITYPSENRHY